MLQDFKFQFELYIANMSGAQKRKLSSEKKEEEMKKFQKLIKCSERELFLQCRDAKLINRKIK